MKIKYLFASIAVAATMMTGCVGDLDVTPLDPSINMADEAYKNAESYTMALNKLYAEWALPGQNGAGDGELGGGDAGLSVLMRCWWTLQEQSTDEMKNAWPNVWDVDINAQTWGTAKNDLIEFAYQRCMLIVALTNDFLKNIDNAPAEIDKVRYRAEARFNRALAYYTLLDLFAIPPFITEENPSLAPTQKTRPELFAWIEDELSNLRDNLPTKNEAEYGRANQSVVDALLARMYLNAEVYTGQKRYDDCIEACKRVAALYTLASDYSALFMADNGENPDARKEIIFPIICDGQKTQSYGMASLVLGARGGNDENPKQSSGTTKGWDGYRSTQNLVTLFQFEDNSNPTAASILDKRGIFFDKGTSYNITTAIKGTFTTEGWGVYKFTNLRSDGGAGSNETFPDTDFPMFRLGDIYLMYAEAVARGGNGGDMTTAVKYVNDLRFRAFGNNDYKIDEAWLRANNFRNILDERSRELYWEGIRRTDLIRFGLYTSGSYLWPGKGGVITGVGVNNKFNVFPIPATDMSVNESLNQNEGYESNV